MRSASLWRELRLRKVSPDRLMRMVISRRQWIRMTISMAMVGGFSQMVSFTPECSKRANSMAKENFSTQMAPSTPDHSKVVTTMAKVSLSKQMATCTQACSKVMNTMDKESLWKLTAKFRKVSFRQESSCKKIVLTTQICKRSLRIELQHWCHD